MFDRNDDAECGQRSDRQQYSIPKTEPSRYEIADYDKKARILFEQTFICHILIRVELNQSRHAHPHVSSFHMLDTGTNWGLRQPARNARRAILVFYLMNPCKYDKLEE